MSSLEEQKENDILIRKGAVTELTRPRACLALCTISYRILKVNLGPSFQKRLNRIGISVLGGDVKGTIFTLHQDIHYEEKTAF